MTAKQLTGNTAPDASRYACISDGVGDLLKVSITSGSAKQLKGSHAPDGSKYMTLTDGVGTLK